MNRIENLYKKIEGKADCAIISSEINRRYMCSMKSSAGYVLVFKDASYLLIDFRYIEKARSIVTNCEVIMLTDFGKQANELFSKHNVSKIAVESDTVTVSQLNTFRELFSNYEIDSSSLLSNAIRDLRSIKTEEETDNIIKAQRIAEAALEDTLNFIKPGVTEKDIALNLDFYMLKHGAEGISFDTIAVTGKKTSLPHGVPDDETVVKNNTFVLMDFGAVYDGYHSDMTRTVCVGKPTDKMAEVYNIVLKAQERALSQIKAGKTGNEIDALSRDYIKEKGYGEYFGHGLGHSVGMEIHEFPNCNPSSKTVLEKNMIMTVEPGIYLPGEFGVRIEDFVIVEQDGCHNMTKSVKKLRCI